LSGFTPAVAGDEANPSGTNGSFTFTVSLQEGSSATLTTNEIQGIIIASSFTAVKSIDLLLSDDLTVRIINTGNAATGDLMLALSGDNPEAFVLPATTTGSLPVGGETEISLELSAGLAPGVYTAILTVSGEGIAPVTLEISYNVTGTGIKDISRAKPLQARVQNGQLHLSGLVVDELWSVYSITGALVHQSIAVSEEATITLSVRNLYIIQSGNKTLKVLY